MAVAHLMASSFTLYKGMVSINGLERGGGGGSSGGAAGRPAAGRHQCFAYHFGDH